MKNSASNLTPLSHGVMRAAELSHESGSVTFGIFSNAKPTRKLPRIHRLVISIFLFIAFSIPAYADYTIASGANINATALTGQSGILTINGTLTLSSNVSLLGFTSVVINGPSGQIYWTNNSDLTFSSGISISIASTAPGLMPTVGNGNASQRLIVGTTIISVSSDNSNVAAFSFADFNEIGGLPQFTISSNSPACNAALALTITPDRTDPDVSLNYTWSISPSSGTFSANNTNSTTTASTTISPAAGTYTITCTIRANGNIFASKSASVSTNSTPATPATITGPSSTCAPASTTISTTSAGSTIFWYNQAVGGTSIGSSASGANFTINPATTTDYYAQAFNGSCPSSARTAVKTITVNTAPSITGTLSLCANVTEQLTGSGTPAGASPWQSSATGVATVSSTGLVTGVAAGTTTITYTNNNGCSKTALITVLTVPVISGTTTVCMESTTTLSATGTPAAATPWVSASSGVATVNSAGLVTPVTAGTSTITFTNNVGCTKSVVVTVADLPVISGSSSVCMDNTTQLLATGTPASAPAWVSASTGIATVSNTGLVTPVAAGTSNITFTNTYGCPKTILITVSAIPVISGTTTVCMGNITALIATGTPAPMSAWVSASTGVATVSNAGIITPVAAGTSVITFTNNSGCSKTATVTVNRPAAITAQAVGSAVCMGSNTTLTVTAVGTGATYQWQESSNGGSSWADLPVSALYSGITTNILQVNNPGSQVLLNSYRLRVSTPSGCGNTVWSNGAQFAFKNVWLGNISTDWHTPANWMDGAVPTLSCPAVYIINRSFQPSLASGTAIVNNLVIYSGTLTVSNAVLSIAGSITNNGALDVSNGTLNLNGSSLQTVAGNVFVHNTVKNLTISNPAGVSVIASVAADSLNLSGALSFGAVNNSSLQTGDRVVMVSNAGGTARVNDITNNGINTGNAIVGKVTIQRYFPPRRAWRLFTAPVSGGGSVFDNWQNGGNFQAGTGTYVSAPQATNPMSSNGLDWSLLNNSSLKMGTALSTVANTHTSYLSKNLADTSDNIPYFIFVRGDRDYANTLFPNVNATTLSSKGKLQTGRQTFSASTVIDGFTMIGNPYAALIDFSKLTRNNIHKRMYVWDPYLNTDVGGYVLVDDVDNDGTYSISPASPGGLNQLIQSGQAFWVQTAAQGSASLTFQETVKSAAASNLTAFRPHGPTPGMAINVTLPGANNQSVLLDGFLVQYGENFNKKLDMQDAVKFINTKETIASNRGTSTYALERRPVITAEDTIFIKLTKTSQRNYNLELVPTALNEGLTAYLEDAFTGKRTRLSVSEPSTYNFSITSAAASAAADRFKVVFKQVPPPVPPFSFTQLEAKREAGNIRLSWTVQNELASNAYQVEKSLDGINFTPIDSLRNTAAITGPKTYSSLDENIAYGRNIYRIRYMDSNRQFQYSKSVEVIVENGTTGIGVYPNPVVDRIMNIGFNQMPAGAYVARLLNNNGAILFMKEIRHTGGTSLLPVAVKNETLKGMFVLQITCPDQSTQQVKVLFK
ncbi:MAG: Ig-like domain-containing protein [Ferruginibacter sp.]|nr:Ig-like domain-containing protein [Ferruginibacter sp.]